MRDLTILILLSLLSAPPSLAEQLVPLRDGGVLVIRASGDMVHRDAGGNRLRMRDGEPMEAKDGRWYVMKNDPNWRQILLKGSLNPKL